MNEVQKIQNKIKKSGRQTFSQKESPTAAFIINQQLSIDN